MFKSITSDQVSATHRLYSLLRRLRVIGMVETVTEKVPLSEFGKPIRYNLKFVRYNPDMKGKFTADERLTMLTMWGELFVTDGTSS